MTDPFMAGHEPPTRRPGDFTRSKRGTPYVSDPSGRLVKPKRKSDPPRIATTPYSRPSGFSKIIEDMYSIHKWDERQIATGIAVAFMSPNGPSGTHYKTWSDFTDTFRHLNAIDNRETDEWRETADTVVVKAKRLAKASLAADRGTHAHELTEDDDEGRDIITRIEHGEEMGLTPDVQRSLVAAWRAMLERDQLEILAVEMPVVNDTYRGAGTLDRVGRLIAPLRFRLVTGEIVELPAGWVGILDVKSGKRRLNPNGTVMYWHGYAVQVFLYANGVPYDTETDERGEWQWEIDQHWALIAHLDVLGAIDGKPSCDLILVDLEAGRRAADLCVAAKAWSNESTVFSVAQLDPADVPIPLTSAAAGEVEAVAAAPSPAMSQGADLSDREYELLWAKIRHEHDALPTQQREWVNKLSTQARQSAVTFHTREVQTERSYHLCKALVTLAAGGADDQIAMILLEYIPAPTQTGKYKTLGHWIGSLNCEQAERLATLSDEWATSPIPA